METRCKGNLKMKLNKPKEWFEARIPLEEGEVGAGSILESHYYVVCYGVRTDQTELICHLLTYEGIRYSDWSPPSDMAILKRYYKGNNPVVVISKGPIATATDVKAINGFWELVAWFQKEGMIRC